MRRLLAFVTVAIALVWAMFSQDPIVWGQDEIKVDRRHLRELKAKFWTYGYNPKESMIQNGVNLHIKLPGGLSKITQTGVYSKFVLAGDCEASCSYQLITFPIVKVGYGSMVGLAFDAPEENSWGGIERAFSPRAGNCYVAMTVLPDANGKMQEQIKIVPTNSTKGKIGLRREKSDLIFMVAESPASELAELHRLPFTDETIRSVRFFGDPGGSPTALEAILSDMAIRAEQITSGIPGKELESNSWEWPAVAGGVLVAVLLAWWFLRNRKISG